MELVCVLKRWKFSEQKQKRAMSFRLTWALKRCHKYMPVLMSLMRPDAPPLLKCSAVSSFLDMQLTPRYNSQRTSLWSV